MTEWEANGYTVVRSLVRASLIDALVSEFRTDILPSGQAMLRQPRFAQESGERSFPHAYLASHDLSPEGYMRQGLKDPHSLASYPSVAGLCLRLLCGPEIQSALAAIDPAYKAYTLYQSMMFDANPGTEPHQDSFYIDSEPRGALVGMWLALEDIDERAGRFFVVAGSHRNVNLPLGAMTNAEYLQTVAARMPALGNHIETPALCKGDAILWHVRLVHGAHPVTDSRFSRKSLTAHYVPCDLAARGNARVFTNHIVRTAAGMPYVVTTKPDPGARRVVKAEVHTVDIEGKPTSFRSLMTADGERVVIVE